MHLYHVTPYAYSCLRSGLLPHYARGAMKVVWLCDLAKLEWAIEHVAKNHEVPRNRLAVLAVQVSKKQVIQWRPGIYICRERIVKTALSRATMSC